MMYNRVFTPPERISDLKKNEIFVFGSNLAGAHGGGATRLAYRKFGAIWGQGAGLQGRSYAISTMQGEVETIKPYVDEFIQFAREHKEMTFLVTRIGCGIAGFRDNEIAPLFNDAVDVQNIVLPREFVECIAEKACKDRKRVTIASFIINKKYNMSIFRKTIIRWLVWRGKAVDIWSKSPYPANVLSNLHDNSFCYDGVECGSMEGFLQSLKQKDMKRQHLVCGMAGKDAKRMTNTDWQENQTVWWNGQAIDRQGTVFLTLIKNAYEAMFEQNECFRTALMSTHGKMLYHSKGEQDSCKTILTEREFCGILTYLRDNYDLRD